MNAQLFLNNFDSQFIAAVKSTPTTGTPASELDYGIVRLPQSAGAILGTLTNGDYYILTAFKRYGSNETAVEIMKVTNVDTSVINETRLTVLRGQEGTDPQAYISGDYISLRATASGFSGMMQKSGNLAGLADTAAARANLGAAPLASPTFTGTVGIGVIPQVGKGTLQVPDINGGQLAGNRRLNRNGNFDIWQRGAGPFTVSGYCADGVVASITAGTVDVSRVDFPPGDYYGVTRPKHVLRWNQTVAGAGNALELRIPDVRKLDAKTVTVSFYAGTPSGTVSAYAQARQYFGTGGSTTFYSATQGFTVTPTVTKFTATFDLPSITGKTINTGDFASVVLGWPNAAFDVYISEFQIEYGAVATPFELWDSAVELAACRRWLRVQAVLVNTSATPTCMTIDMAGVPTLSGGGTGFTSTGTTADTLICYQTTPAVQTITMTCEV